MKKQLTNIVKEKHISDIILDYKDEIDKYIGEIDKNIDEIWKKDRTMIIKIDSHNHLERQLLVKFSFRYHHRCFTQNITDIQQWNINWTICMNRCNNQIENIKSDCKICYNMLNLRQQHEHDKINNKLTNKWQNLIQSLLYKLMILNQHVLLAQSNIDNNNITKNKFQQENEIVTTEYDGDYNKYINDLMNIEEI